MFIYPDQHFLCCSPYFFVDVCDTKSKQSIKGGTSSIFKHPHISNIMIMSSCMNSVFGTCVHCILLSQSGTGFSFMRTVGVEF